MKKVKLRLKPGVLRILKIFGVMLALIFVVYIWYSKQISGIMKLGYSEVASKKIFFDKNKEYIINVKENKTLNAALESDIYEEKYLKNYAKITYYEQKDLIKNINKLLAKGYSNNDISIIISHGTNADVGKFAERERVKYLEEFYEFPYAKIKYYDRYIAYSDETGHDEETTVIHVNLGMDKKEYEDAVTINEFSMEMLVNKFHALDSNFVPDDLMTIPKEYTGDEDMIANRKAVSALIQLIECAKAEGYGLEINSAYRSYQDQEDIIEYYRKWYGDSYVNNYVARAGYSEHQTGLAFDIGSTKSNVFAQSKEYGWMQENAYKYGFVLRFYKNVENITGFKSEPWHYRYVGKEIAKYIYEKNITLEEYYVMFLDKEKTD